MIQLHCFNIVSTIKKSNNVASILITIVRLVQAQHQRSGRDLFTHWLMFYQLIALIINCFTHLSAAGRASPYSVAKASFTQDWKAAVDPTITPGKRVDSTIGF